MTCPEQHVLANKQPVAVSLGGHERDVIESLQFLTAPAILEGAGKGTLEWKEYRSSWSLVAALPVQHLSNISVSA